MRATIDLPERVFHALQSRAGQEGSSLEDVIVHVLEKETEPKRTVVPEGKRVCLPLVMSKSPGALRSLTSGEIDEILG